MAKYQIRVNIITEETVGEGDFYWFADETIPQPSQDSNYGVNPRHWSTTVYEIIPSRILPNLTGEKDWKLESHKEDGIVYARFVSSGNTVAIVELCDENGFILGNWKEEDRIPPGPALTVIGNGMEVPCNTAHEAAYSVAQMIINNCGPRYVNLPAKRW